MMGLSAIVEFFGRVPWQVYVAALLLALLPVSYCKGKSVGKQQVIAQLKAAEEKAKKEAAVAAAVADENQAAKTIEFEAQQEILGKAIENAEATGTNPLDDMFGSLP